MRTPDTITTRTAGRVARYLRSLGFRVTARDLAGRTVWNAAAWTAGPANGWGTVELERQIRFAMTGH